MRKPSLLSVPYEYHFVPLLPQMELDTLITNARIVRALAVYARLR